MSFYMGEAVQIMIKKAIGNIIDEVATYCNRHNRQLESRGCSYCEAIVCH
jgi:hypothetical protein